MKTQLKVEGMKCMGCVAAVKNELEGIDGVEGVSVDLDSGLAVIQGDFSLVVAIERVTALGYPAVQIE